MVILTKIHRYLDDLSDIFKESLAPDEILEPLEFYLDTNINTKLDAVFFDEIQDCPGAFTSLKYFYEEMPELGLFAAGSLLGVVHSEESFPVGKVSFLNSLYGRFFKIFRKGKSK